MFATDLPWARVSISQTRPRCQNFLAEDQLKTKVQVDNHINIVQGQDTEWESEHPGEQHEVFMVSLTQSQAGLRKVEWSKWDNICRSRLVESVARVPLHTNVIKRWIYQSTAAKAAATKSILTPSITG
jgi:hypothetical protein